MNDLSPEECEALEHLLFNKIEIKKEIDASHQIFPPHLVDIYLDHFKEHGLKIINKHIQQFNLHPESICSIVNTSNINYLLGNDFLVPPERMDSYEPDTL